MRLKLLTSMAVACIVAGCATLQPGADPLVVRTEQAQTMARSTFDMVLTIDHSDRGFWRTNAPVFHSFCEWLRTPTDYRGATVARCVSAELLVDDAKTAYKTAKSITSSNALWTSLLVLQELTTQATAWQIIATSPTYPTK